MKLVFTQQEVAEALGQSVEDFAQMLPRLESLGFPHPVPGLGAHWAIMDVIDWINQDREPALDSGTEEVGCEQSTLGSPRPN